MVSLFVFLIQLSLFTILVISLHYYSPRIGLAPLIFTIGGIIGLLNLIELNSLSIVLGFGYTLRPAAHVFVPVSLLSILLLYVVHGTRSAQIVVQGIIGVNLIVLMTLFFLLSYVNFHSPNSVVTGAFTNNIVFNLPFVRAMIASLIAFVADMLILIIVYQGTYNHLKWIPKWLIPGIALIIALWTDSILFNIGAFLGTDLFSFSIPSDVLMKSFSALWIMPFAGLYLTRFAPHIPEFIGADKRPTLDILLHSGNRDKQVETLESELRISRSIYNQLTQNIEEIFWLIDLESNKFLYISPAYERITGYSTDMLYQDFNNVMEIFYFEDREFEPSNILQFLASQREVEFQIMRPNKTIRWLRARAFPVKDEHGTIIRYAGIAEDITEQKKLSQQDFELALTRERVKVLNDFISDASHDLKTPLSAITLKLGLLDRIEDDSQRQKLRQELKERAQYLSDLISDLFTLSRIEGHYVIEVDTINLNEIVTDVVSQTAILAEDKELRLSANLSRDDMSFEGNREQIKRVVSNLISNAIRYTAEGQIDIETWLESEQVCIYVRDTGMGISADNIEQVFDRFFRTTKAKDTQDGTGLGLAIAKAIVDRHKGEIFVKSIEGDGATFTLKLPKAQETLIFMTDDRRMNQEIRAIPPNA